MFAKIIKFCISSNLMNVILRLFLLIIFLFSYTIRVLPVNAIFLRFEILVAITIWSISESISLNLIMIFEMCDLRMFINAETKVFIYMEFPLVVHFLFLL